MTSLLLEVEWWTQWTLVWSRQAILMLLYTSCCSQCDRYLPFLKKVAGLFTVSIDRFLEVLGHILMSVFPWDQLNVYDSELNNGWNQTSSRYRAVDLIRQSHLGPETRWGSCTWQDVMWPQKHMAESRGARIMMTLVPSQVHSRSSETGHPSTTWHTVVKSKPRVKAIAESSLVSEWLS